MLLIEEILALTLTTASGRSPRICRPLFKSRVLEINVSSVGRSAIETVVFALKNVEGYCSWLHPCAVFSEELVLPICDGLQPKIVGDGVQHGDWEFTDTSNGIMKGVPSGRTWDKELPLKDFIHGLCSHC